jgi:AraC family transcriptional regulator, regulatory protein of adaptative response / methylphosphotriester-DNA alkyltransferase methyltransferase
MIQRLPKKIFARKSEITAEFLNIIDAHLNDIIAERTLDMFEIRDIAAIMHIHPTHLSNVIKLTTGKAPCYFFEEKIMAHAKNMLMDSSKTISQIAITLTYDPSNFTKFFKHFSGFTPKQYREQFLNAQLRQTKNIAV